MTPLSRPQTPVCAPVIRLVAPRRLPRLLTRALAATLLAGAALVGGVGASTAPPLRGANDPAFVQALDLWLEDDEAGALPALAALAGSGNAAARLLLAQIDKMPALQGPYLATQSRARRIALLRAEGGMSGQSWMTAEAGHPLADAWLSLRHPGIGPEVIAVFTALGESRAAREAFITLAAREEPGLTALDPAAIDPELRYLLWFHGSPQSREGLADLLPEGHPQRALLGEDLPGDALLRWLSDSPAATPVAALCAATCPEAAEACMTAAYTALGSHDTLLMLGSPAETLVAQQRFAETPRGQAAVLRRILLGHPMRGRRAMLNRIAAQSECLGNALTDELDRFRAARIGNGYGNGNGG